MAQKEYTMTGHLRWKEVIFKGRQKQAHISIGRKDEMFEYVEDQKLKPVRAYTVRRKTDMIILHHFASDASPQQVHRYHIGRGHKGIDYNIVVMLDGRAVWGRGLTSEGGHVENGGATKGLNARSVGIACQGNFDERTMPLPQKETLLKVIWDCLCAYPEINTVVGHRELKATACPGRNYPLFEAKSQLQMHKDSLGADRDRTEPSEVGCGRSAGPGFMLTRLLRFRIPYLRGDDVETIQRELISQGFSVGRCGADGVFGKDTESGVRAFQRSRKLRVDGVVGEKTTVALGGAWEGK